MLSLRNAVIALVASAALVLVLVGVSAGVFTSQPSPPSVGQSASVNQGVTTPNRAVPMPPDVAAPVPAAPAPAPAPAAPVQHAAAPAPVPSEPVTHYRPAQMPVQQQPAPAAQPVTSVAPLKITAGLPTPLIGLARPRFTVADREHRTVCLRRQDATGIHPLGPA